MSRSVRSVVVGFLAFVALVASQLVACTDATSGGALLDAATAATTPDAAGGGDTAADLGQSWFVAAGTEGGVPFDFAARAMVISGADDFIATSADGSSLGFSLGFRFAGVTTDSPCTRCLGLTHRTREGRSAAMIPVTGGVVSFTAIGGPGEFVDGNFTLDLDAPENATFPAIAIQATGRFHLYRKP